MSKGDIEHKKTARVSKRKGKKKTIVPLLLKGKISKMPLK
jgi:hypothetical protein